MKNDTSSAYGHARSRSLGTVTALPSTVFEDHGDAPSHSERIRARRERIERHRSGRAGWLRAGVLGANDAIVSTASLMIGVAAAAASSESILVAGVAGLAAGAASMAVGEYVSVSSQRDAEKADIILETKELLTEPAGELQELAGFYVSRGLDETLAMEVARQLSARDQLGAHLKDELGIDTLALAKPLQAAWISAASFAMFGTVPIVALLVSPAGLQIPTIALLSLASLALLGALGGHLGSAPLTRASLRVTVGGAGAMLLTALIGRLVGGAGP